MRTCRCACGQLITLPDLMELWDVPMLAHVRGIAHQAWSRLHVDTLLAGASTSETRGTAGDPSNVYTSGKAV